MFPHPSKLAQNAANPAPGFKLDGMVMEVKYDGFRLLVNIPEAGQVIGYTRTGNSASGKLPHIESALAGLPAGTWLDGELVAFDTNGNSHWGSVQSIMGAATASAAARSHTLTYVVFDILAFDGLDLRPLPLTERRRALETVTGMVDDEAVVLTPQVAASDAVHEHLIAQGWEGSIVKDPSKPYASGKRGAGWVKLKASDELDVVVMGFEAGRDHGVILFGQHKDGVLVQRGRCKRFAANRDLAVGDVISVAHNGIMPSGSPRHAQWKRDRPDKPAGDCVWT